MIPVELTKKGHSTSSPCIPAVRRVDTGPNAISGAASSVKGLSAAADGLRTPLAGDARLISDNLWGKSYRLNNRGDETP